MAEPEWNDRESDRDNSQENRAAEPSSHENGNQYKTRGSKQDLRIGNPSKPDIRSGIATIIFALRKPINAINKPMPAAVRCLRQSGMALTTCSRMLLSVSKTPERNTTPSAVFHGTPRPRTME